MIFKRFFKKRLIYINKIERKETKISIRKHKRRFLRTFKRKFANLYREVHYQCTVLYKEKIAKKYPKKFNKNKKILNNKKKKKKFKLKDKIKINNMEKPLNYKYNNLTTFKYFFKLFRIKMKRIAKKNRYIFKRKVKHKIIQIKRRFKKLKRNIREKFRYFFRAKNFKYMNYIRKYLKIKSFIYNADILTNGLQNTRSNKSNIFMYKIRQLSNKIFIYKRIGTFLYPRNISKIKISKICNNLGHRTFRPLLYTSLLNKNKIKIKEKSKIIKYSPQKYIKKYLLLNSSDIKLINFMFKNFRKKIVSRYRYKTIRNLFNKHKFLKYIFQKKFKNIYLKNIYLKYKKILKKKIVNKKLNHIKKFFKRFLIQLKKKYKNILEILQINKIYGI